MKTSLGRRSSSRNPQHADYGARSGIPVRRAASTDRYASSNMFTPISRQNEMRTPKTTKRSASEDRNSMMYLNAGNFTGGRERPSRATTVSRSNSDRYSSYGGKVTKRDIRPIEDKEWQIGAQQKIENFLNNDQFGRDILINGSIKPITLKLFISVVDFLLQKLFGTPGRTFINKENYISELPFIMKTLLYRGKLEKSWLISVNTARSWCHALACMEFLVSCLTSQMGIDPMALMFPEKYDKDEEDDFWDYQLLLPYFQKSYKLYSNGDPQYEELQEQLDNKAMEQHISNDNVFERIESIECDIGKIRKQTKYLESKKNMENSALKELDAIFNHLKDEKGKLEETIARINKQVEDFKNGRRDMDIKIERLGQELQSKLVMKAKIENTIKNQQISHVQIAELRQKRDSLQREIDRESTYVSKFEDLMQQSSLEFLSQKKQIDNLIKTYNLEIMKYLSYNLENAMLEDYKKPEEEINQALEVAQNAITYAKQGIQQLSSSNSQTLLDKANLEIKSLENQLLEKNDIIKKMMASCQNNEEIELKLQEEIKLINRKLEDLNNGTEYQDIVEKKKEAEKKAKKMEELLSNFRGNAAYQIKGRMQLIEEYERKAKELVEEYSKKIKKF